MSEKTNETAADQADNAAADPGVVTDTVTDPGASREQRAKEKADAVAKYAPTPHKTKRDAIRARFAGIRANIVHAANGDRQAMASVLHHLVDLHQGPLADDSATDHLRNAGAAVVLDRQFDAHVALSHAQVMLPPGPATDHIDDARVALAASDGPRALEHIDQALDEATAIEGPLQDPDADRRDADKPGAV